MIRSSEEILADIDATLDQLIENADVMKIVSIESLFTCEVEALQKTQESLLARLVHMNDLLNDKKKNEESSDKGSFNSIEQKVLKFGKLNEQMIHRVSSQLKRSKKSKKPRVGPHRRKGKIKTA